MNTENVNKTNGKLPICGVIARFIKRSKTNYNELCKQYFIIAGSEGKETALIIRKNVLVKENFEMYEKYGFELLKQYKDYRLYKQVFSIKLTTLSEVVRWVNGL